MHLPLYTPKGSFLAATVLFRIESWPVHDAEVTRRTSEPDKERSKLLRTHKSVERHRKHLTAIGTDWSVICTTLWHMQGTEHITVT